jgi:hypothetical protein
MLVADERRSPSGVSAIPPTVARPPKDEIPASKNKTPSASIDSRKIFAALEKMCVADLVEASLTRFFLSLAAEG